MQALRKGAASYVAKRNLAAELVDTVLSVLEIARADLSQKHILACLTQTESHYELGNDIGAIAPLIGQLEANLNRMQLCDETGLIRVAVALREALVNAIYHGNLDLTSALLEDDEAQFTRAGGAPPARGAVRAPARAPDRARDAQRGDLRDPRRGAGLRSRVAARSDAAAEPGAPHRARAVPDPHVHGRGAPQRRRQRDHHGQAPRRRGAGRDAGAGVAADHRDVPGRGSGSLPARLTHSSTSDFLAK